MNGSTSTYQLLVANNFLQLKTDVCVDNGATAKSAVRLYWATNNRTQDHERNVTHFVIAQCVIQILKTVRVGRYQMRDDGRELRPSDTGRAVNPELAIPLLPLLYFPLCLVSMSLLFTVITGFVFPFSELLPFVILLITVFFVECMKFVWTCGELKTNLKK